MNKIKCKVPLYGTNIRIIFFEENSEVEEYGIDTRSYNAITCERVDVHNNFFIALIFNSNEITPGIIAHESKHAVNSIFDRVGIKLDVNNDEAECYLLGWIVNRVHESIRKFNLKIK